MSRPRRRQGNMVLEVVVVMAGAILLLTIAMQVFGSVLQLHGQTEHLLTDAQALAEFSEDFRDAVHHSERAEVDAAGTLVLRQPDAIVRIVLTEPITIERPTPDRAIRPQTYRLSMHAVQASIEPWAGSKQPLVVLRLEPRPRRHQPSRTAPMRLEAVLGRSLPEKQGGERE